MKYIFLFCLIAYSLCTSKMDKPGEIADLYKGLKAKIYKCVAESGNISARLKELANKNLNCDETKPLMFLSIELTREDKIVIRNCKKEAFKKNVNKDKK